MGSKFASGSFLLCVALALQCSHTITAFDDHGHLQRMMMMKHEEDHEHPSAVIDPSQKIFFTINDLKAGKRMPFYFSIKDPSTTPRLLPREEADSIPFSSAHLPELLQLFSFPRESPQAKAMEYTLTQCELQPLKGETKFCANSLESMLDSARNFFGLGTKFKALTTKHHHHLSRGTHVPFQNYTVLGMPREIPTPKMVACHTMPYPYAVFYCHGQESDRKVFEIWLEGENGERVEAFGVCHMDTSQWDPDHVAFHLLKTRPGGCPVCHVFPADNPIWVASSPTM